MRSILFLSTYPIVKPMHGGQIRVRKLVDYFLKKNWNVKHIAIYEEETYHKEDVADSDIAFPVSSSYREYNSEKIPFITDYLSGIFSTSESSVFNKVLSLLPDSLDIIQVEQLWLWPLAEKIKRHEKYSKVKLVLSSHNIEHELKERIFGKYKLDKFSYIIDKIKDLEKYAASKADLICAVTEYDANILSNYGAQEVIVAPNAVEPWHAKDEKIRYWSNKLPKSPWMLYVASAHPPNFTDFNECVGHSLACIPPDSKLVVVGSVCEHLYTEVSKSKWSNLNTSRLLLLNKLADEDLDAVKTLAHGFLLPIVEGGGSNLKTAEALYSGGYVVSTPQALRGFTRFIDAERVKVFNSPAEFHSHSRDILSRNKYQITDDDISNMHSLTWDASIDKLYISFEYMLRVI